MAVQIFDADQHPYETEEALTRFAPDRCKGVIKYVEINGRKKLVIRDKITKYRP